MRSVAVSGGGTGGHFYPAFSLSKFLYEKGYKVNFFGSKRGIESKKKFPYGEKYLFDISGIRGKGISKKILSSTSLLKSAFQIRNILKEIKPEFSICFGGYASLPLGIASILENIPLFLHEQNSIPSYTNKILSYFSKKIFITFDFSKRFFPQEKVIHTGMPIRATLKERLKIKKEEARKILNIPVSRKTVLVFGGSQGARKLTEIAINVSKKNPEIQFLIITGKNSYVKNPPENVKVFEYFEDMGLLYRASDLVVSRSGAGTVSELILFGKPAIFIPYPYAASNHQYYNVKWLEEMDLSIVIQEKDLTEESLEDAIFSMFEEDIEMKERLIKDLSIDNAEERIYSCIINEIYKQ